MTECKIAQESVGHRNCLRFASPADPIGDLCLGGFVNQWICEMICVAIYIVLSICPSSNQSICLSVSLYPAFLVYLILSISIYLI